MSEHEQRNGSNAFHLEGGTPIFDKPKTQEEIDRVTREREQHQFASDQVSTNRRMARFTGSLVLLTFMGACISIWQGYIAQTSANAAKSASETARKTLTEMQIGSGATDTHSLAQQALTQARQTTRLADETHDLTSQAKVQSEATQLLAIHTESLAKIAEQQLNSSERPWMKADIRLAADQGEPPIRFDERGALYVKVLVIGQNVGKSPAMRVQISSELVPNGTPNLEKIQMEMCEKKRKLSPNFQIFGEGDAVFPTEPYQVSQLLDLSKDQINAELLKPSNDRFFFTLENGRRLNVQVLGSDNIVSNLSKSPAFSPAPSFSIIGCIDYFTDYSNTRHQTMYSFELTGVDFRSHDLSKASLSKSFGIGNSAN